MPGAAPPRTASPLYRLTADQFDRMCASGIIPEGRRVELLGGKIYEVTRGQPHAITVIRLANLLRPMASPDCYVSEEKPACQGRYWKPEPDTGTVRGRPEDDPTDPPDSTALRCWSRSRDELLDRRRQEAPPVRQCRRAGVLDRRPLPAPVEVHTDPSGRGRAAVYKQVAYHVPGDLVPVAIDGREVGRIAVADILPPG